MGTKITPTYATVTLPYLKENLYKIIGKKCTYNANTEFTVETLPTQLPDTSTSSGHFTLRPVIN